MNKKLIYNIYICICSLILVLLMLFFFIPRVDYNYDKELDCYYVNHVYGNAKEYTIADEIDGKKVLYIDEKAFHDKTRLETIILGKNIVTIERLAFNNCQKLKFIDLSNVKIIERNAFMNCTSLESLDLSSCLDLMGGAFFDCRILKEVKLSVIKSIGTYAFTGTAISEIVLPESLELIGVNAFENCNTITKIKCYSKTLINDEYLLSLGSLVEFL